MKYTIIYEERWQSGSHWHSLTKCARFDNLSIKRIMESDYGQKAVFVFEGWPLMVGTTEIEMIPIENV